ncbi:ShlB/FhaC/HecB family hemolysin secretion/activation protein [Duganella callida]|uniref:ShlB/FhaC/HecB family hemolysin secretion/activation protein n=1 Tax=Duganella callida TaxID=2561932 RepID=A0A4Y9SEM2_9BURK|nr:ShlB/FhaC/HecB family hemolysin secretion/activation protein [Duganella callida]TFW19158.1 ShlB/FhaC/HecB family hemolysin secretion/activation protein [Duganella callida]
MRYSFTRLLAGSVLAAAVATAHAADATDDGALRFEISRFEVTGNTLLPPAQIDAIVGKYSGKQRDFGDVQRALEALEAAYHERGYNVVTIELPEQELNGGVVTLRVVETKVGRVSVKNNQYFDEANIRRSLPALQEGRSPNLQAVSANLKQGNESPAKQVTMKLQSGEKDDEVDAVLDVKDESPWKVMANADNTGTDATGKTHVGVILQNANLFNRDHLASLQYTTSAEEPGRVKVYGAGYHIPLYASGDSLDFYASYSNVDSGTVAAGSLNLAVSGKGAVYGARYNQALAKRGELESRLSYGVDVKAFKNSVQFEGTELGNDVTVHPLSIAYQGTLPIPLGEAGGQLTLLRNVSGGANGDQRAFTGARIGARADYTILRLAGSVTRAFTNEWQVRAIVNAQYSNDALIPGEQFGAGGATSVRGYIEREVSNDSGASVNLEAYTPNLCKRANWNCRLLGFYDAAYLSRNKGLAGEIDSMTIASAGVGARLVLSTYANLQLDYGHTLRAGATTRDNANRLHVRLGLAY